VPRIERHKAAIARNFSRPVRLAIEAGLFSPGTTFFDYGSGHGALLASLQQGCTSAGWDPYYSPDNPCTPADVNLGYVINVIEDQLSVEKP